MRREEDDPRRLSWLAALAYPGFIIFGRLAPVEFRTITWNEAVAPFAAIPCSGLAPVCTLTGRPACCCSFRGLPVDGGVLGRCQFSANGACDTGAGSGGYRLECRHRIGPAFFPQRRVSQKDLHAEAPDGVIGVQI